MNAIYFLAILSYFVSSVSCETTNSTLIEVCDEKCKDICIPCEEPIKCTEDQKDCGLGKPDPKYGGACPPHSICVAKNFNCPCYDENGKAYPSTTVVDCSEDEIICTGASPGNGCPGQDVCVARGMDNNGKLCDGFCPIKCEENQLHCSSHSETGCAQPTECVPKSVDSNGNFCPTQQCPIICLEVDFFCAGAIVGLGCKEKDICVPREVSIISGELCAGKCPVTCDPVKEKHCEGQVDPTGCKGPDVCHAKARDLNGEFCPDNSDSHGCPITCPEDEILCQAKMNILGCKEQATCVKKVPDSNGNDCPETSVCPTICQPNEVPCSGGTDENGCKKPDVCVSQERDYTGKLCPIQCPGICGEHEILCEGPKDELGCKTADKCFPRGTKTEGDDFGGLCPGVCPVTCKHDEVKCSGVHDCDGCITEDICHPKVKDKNGMFCEDDSASHNCPVECDETVGHVVCPTKETPLGCKPKAICIPRPEISKGEYCPSHSICLKECQSDEMLCSDGVDSQGCKNADLCLARGADNDGNLCPALCPPTCSDAESFCAGTIQNNGCRGESHCVEKKSDVNGIECPAICPLFCAANEHRIPGGKDARGCPVQDTCVVACTGGDACCNSLTNKCDVGEGDCDSDADCLDGLKCGEDNCPTTRSASWDSTDDCCYKPSTPVTCASQAKGNLQTSKGDGAVGVCVFPFTYYSTTYTSCAELETYGGVGWCAWDAAYQSGRWGYCTSSCPACVGDCCWENPSSSSDGEKISGVAWPITGVESVEDCAQRCKDTASCNGFHYYGKDDSAYGDCYIKQNVTQITCPGDDGRDRYGGICGGQPARGTCANETDTTAM